MSYLQVPIKIEKDAVLHYRVVGPSETEPTPADGYAIDSESIEISGVEGKFWIEYKIVET